MFKSGHLVTTFLFVLLCIASQQVVSAGNVQLKGEGNVQAILDKTKFNFTLDLSNVGNYYTDTLGNKFELKIGGCTIPFETKQCDQSTGNPSTDEPNHLTIPGAAPTGQDYFHVKVVTFFVDDSKIVSDLTYLIGPTEKQFEVKCKVQFNANLVSEKYVIDVSLSEDVHNQMLLTINDAELYTAITNSNSISSTTSTASTKAYASNQPKGLPLWAIILISVAVVFIVLLIILSVVGFCIFRSRKLKKQKEEKKKQSDFTEMTVTTVNETTQEAFKDKTEVTKSNYGAGPTQKVKIIDSSQMGQVAPPVIASIAPIHAKPASAKEKVPAKDKAPAKKEKKSVEKPDKSMMPAKEKTQHSPFVAPNLFKATVPGVDLD